MPAKLHQEDIMLGNVGDTGANDTDVIHYVDDSFDFRILDVIVIPAASITEDDSNYSTFTCSVGGNTVFTFTTKDTGGVASAIGDLIRTGSTGDATFTSANAVVSAQTVVKCQWAATGTGAASDVSVILQTRPNR